MSFWIAQSQDIVRIRIQITQWEGDTKLSTPALQSTNKLEGDIILMREKHRLFFKKNNAVGFFHVIYCNCH